MDLVSIILPVYNGEKYISKCIESLQEQTYKNIEILFVDDGSTDNTKQIIESYQKKDHSIKYIYQKNNRQGSARNNGLKHAKGKYVCFIDSDDFIDKKMVEEMHESIIKNDYDIVICDYLICKPNETIYTECYFEPFKDINDVKPSEYVLSTPSPCNKLYKKDFLINNNFHFLEGIFYEDYGTIPTLAKYNPKISYIHKAYLHYMQTENSTMRSSEYKSSFEDVFPASEYLYNELKDIEELHNELEYLIIYHLLYNSSIVFNEYGKLDNLSKINSFIEQRFPKWYNNKYYKRQNLKFRIICRLFYKNKLNIINFIRKCKGSYVKKSRKEI